MRDFHGKNAGNTAEKKMRAGDLEVSIVVKKRQRETFGGYVPPEGEERINLPRRL